MINISFASKQELYDLIFDMQGRGDEKINNLNPALLIQYKSALDGLVHYDVETGALWRMNAWQTDYTFWQQQKSRMASDNKKWNLMKEAARELHKGKLKLEYELAWQLVQDLVKKKGKMFFDAVGLTGEKWKGLME